MSTVLLSVGDASGDVYAGDFVRELRALRPGTQFLGLGGAEMAKAGVEIVVDQRELAVSGLIELIPDIHRIVRTWRRMVAALRARRPDLVVLVDSSGLNIPFARRARRLGVPTLYYVSPQVWGWRTGRIRKIARWVNRLAVIFPFEPAVYADTDVPVEFVGHPLVERLRESSAKLDRATAREMLGLDVDVPIAALLPGSRRGETRYMLPPLLETARVLHARDPSIHFVLPVAPSVERAVIEDRIPLLGCPLVVVARSSRLTAAVLRRLAVVEFLAMPNLIAGEPIVPEFIQEDAEPERIADAVQALLAGAAREQQLARLAVVRESLSKGGAARRAAEIAAEMIGARLGA